MTCMQERLEKIHVENFKSLKDFEIELNKFNVLIGSNGSGKTNVLELFKFINLCVNPTKNPPYPFAPWWGFNNMVWSGQEDLPIHFSLQYSVHNTTVNYTAAISGSAGKFFFLMENFDVDNLVNIKRNYDTVEFLFSQQFLEENKDSISESYQEKLHSSFVHTIPANQSFLSSYCGLPAAYSSDQQLGFGEFFIFKNGPPIDPVPFVTPIIHYNNRKIPLLPRAKDFLTLHNYIILLRQLNLNKIRQPSPIGKNTSLAEDGGGLVNLLFDWHTQSGGNLPDRITDALEELFPGWQIAFTVTDDGRIMLNVNEGDLRFSPTSIPDGFYKLLAILAAVELRPRVLLIDEVDTSLHAKIIEYLLSTFKTADSTVIITTHSPLVIDLVDLEDLVLLERIGNETHSHRIQDPSDMRKRLQEKGLTASDSWLYAKL